MRILQLVDTLRPGGAERMAVSYANALTKHVELSCLCCTRQEGLLKITVSPEVKYIFLNRKFTLDLRAFWKLKEFVRVNNINLIQAHSSSWFLALMVKLSVPGLKLVWHDHYGRSLTDRNVRLLKAASGNFNAIISVNSELENWAKSKLNSKKVQYIPNFLPDEEFFPGSGYKILKKVQQENIINIICVANLRPQKDHLNLLEAFRKLYKQYPVKLHLIGKDEKTAYSEQIKLFIKQHNLQENVFLYGEQSPISSFLFDADIGVLSSSSEGLPVALLEYGKAGLPVVCTDVGQCREVLGNYGKLVPPKDPVALAANIEYYVRNWKEREQDASLFKQKVLSTFSESAILGKTLYLLKNIK